MIKTKEAPDITKNQYKSSDIRFKILRSEKELSRLIDACNKTKYCSHDFETNAKQIPASDFYPTILGTSFQPGSALILPLAHFESPFLNKSKWEKLLIKYGKEVIENPDIVKLGWNIKFEAQIWKRYGIEMRGILIDAMLAKYALDEERPNDLKSMTQRYIPERSGYEENYEGSSLPWDKKPLLGLSQYCAMDCDNTFRLGLFFESKLMDNGLYELFRNLLMMASRVLTDAEYMGALVDIELLNSLSEKYTKLIHDKEREIRSINQIVKFDKYSIRKRKEKYIESIQEDIVNLRKEYKKLKKSGEEKKAKSKQRSILSKEKKITDITTGITSNKKERDIYAPINFQSPKQLIELLFNSKRGFKFEVVKYTVDKKTKKETKTPSTAEDVLLELKKIDKSKFISNLLDLRGYSQINSTFINGIRERICDDGRIHGRFLIHGTVTGRLSSQDPNLQNLPRDTTNEDIKRMFIPPPGYVFLAMDYSQAELRVLASVSREHTMLEWFRTGKDVHLASALKKYKCLERYDEIKALLSKEDGSEEYVTWKKRRKQAKTINFGIVYEQSAMKLAESLSTNDEVVTVEDAQKFLDAFNKDFPAIAKFIEKQHKLVKKQGYVTNLFGRKRRLPNIWSNSYREMLEAQRFSTNAPIQGTASDFALFSSILIWERVRRGLLPELRQTFTVHDSLVFIIKPEDVHKAVPELDRICSDPETKKWWGFKLKGVSMEMDFEVGHNYKDLHKYDKNKDYSELLNKAA